MRRLNGCSSLARSLQSPPALSLRSSRRNFSLSAQQRSYSTPPSPTPSSPAPGPDHDAGFSTVSPDEVRHFDALASSWWDPQGPSRILHQMNPLRHDFISRCRRSVGDHRQLPPQAGLKYLDVGCGGGIFAESAARLPTAASVTAIDPSPELISIARAHAKRDPAVAPSTSGKLRYVNTSIEKLPPPASPREAFDVVSVFEVVEHVSHPADFLDRCAPFVRPGGWLVLSTIARTWTSWLTTTVVAEDLLRIVPRGTHDWRKYINAAELEDHFLRNRPAGLWTDARRMGVVYVPGLGWKEVSGSEKVGNYFFAVRKAVEA